MLEKLAELFSGLERAHGEYLPQKEKNKIKVGGKAVTIKEPVTLDLWRQHVEGVRGLGVIPIKDNNKCSFGAIDIDSYENFDPAAIEKIVRENNWPLMVCRSKSGGAHVFLFCSEEIAANIVRAKLKEFSLALGHANAEIFPKQDRLHSKDDVGNWINMPYFDAKRTTRYAIDNGQAIDLDEFIETAFAKSTTQTELTALKISSNEFSDAPPCLEQLTIVGFPRGSMNNALFNMGVYARMKHPDDWQRHIHDFNERFMGPGDAKEVQQIIKSLDKKKYIYRCTEQPICQVCNKIVCATRAFGISSGSLPYKATNQKQMRPCFLDDVQAPVECYLPPANSDDEPYWVFRIHGTPMDVTIDMVQSQAKFLRNYLKKFRRVALAIDETRWAVAINDLLAEAIEHELAPDAGPEGQLWIHLESFCTGRVQAKAKDELALGKPWRDTEDEEGVAGRVYFRSQDFMKYLDTQRFKEFKEREIYAILRRNGAKHHKFMIKGKCISCWSIDEFKSISELYPPPNVKQSEF